MFVVMGCSQREHMSTNTRSSKQMRVTSLLAFRLSVRCLAGGGVSVRSLLEHSGEPPGWFSELSARRSTVR